MYLLILGPLLCANQCARYCMYTHSCWCYHLFPEKHTVAHSTVKVFCWCHRASKWEDSAGIQIQPAISKPMLTINDIIPLYAQCHNSIKYLIWKKGTSRGWLSLQHLGTAGVQQDPREGIHLLVLCRKQVAGEVWQASDNKSVSRYLGQKWARRPSSTWLWRRW